MRHKRCSAYIDLGAIRHNLTELKGRCREGMLTLTTVKADGYGHGAVRVAKTIEDLTDYFAAACVAEGEELRAAGITAPILILGPVFPEDYEAALRAALSLVVFDVESAELLGKAAARVYGDGTVNASGALDSGKCGIAADIRPAALKRRCTVDIVSAAKYTDNGFADGRAHVHIAVDTGMSRIGLRPDESGAAIIEAISHVPGISIDGIFTHFATADEADKCGALKAEKIFRDFVAGINNLIDLGIRHCANTAAVIGGIGISDEYDMVRLGIGTYGLRPSSEVDMTGVSLIPAMSWKSYLTMVKDIEAGTSVSYGYRFTADRKMRIGTVCCGYADGYPRLISPNGGEVLVRGKRCRILGTVCMDQFMADLTTVPDAVPGDEVTLIGKDGDEYISADEIAEKCSTISYELICGVSRRVERIYR